MCFLQMFLKDEDVNQPSKARYEYFDKGIFIDPMVSKDILLSFTNKLRPVKLDQPLIRVGDDKDGGYLIPDDLTGIHACFSPGVDDIASFEQDLLAKGIGSHLADYSVESIPAGTKALSFEKKFLGASSHDNFISLEDWVNKYEPNASENSLLLQMDIEGAEYQTLLSCPEYILNKFKIMVVEFHSIETWSQVDFLNIVESTFNKLLKSHTVVHNHPNNAMGIVNLNGFKYPRLIELTFYKNNLFAGSGLASLPHPLDRPNVNYLPPLDFPNN